MRLQNLVGRKVIRTGELVRKKFDIEVMGMFSPIPTQAQIAGYTDKPVTVIAVEGCQIVIEESNGKRKLLPREYDDDFWTDYEKLMHPEEERKKEAEELLTMLEDFSKPIRDLLEKLYDPMCQVVIGMEEVKVIRSEMGTGKVEKKECEYAQEEKNGGGF